MREGAGIYCWNNNKDTYGGTWKSNEQDGVGIFSSESSIGVSIQIPGFVPTPDSSTCKIQPLVRGFIGAYKDNQRHGYGQATMLLDGSFYCGDWQNDLFYGNGELRTPCAYCQQRGHEDLVYVNM